MSKFNLPHCVLSLFAASMLALTMSAFADETKGSKPRFQFCTDPGKNCMPGNGYGVCEAYLKHLNAMPSERGLNGCVVWRDPARMDFTLPKWEPLDVLQHLDWIYQMEKFIKY